MAHGQYPVAVLHVYLRLTYLSTSTTVYKVHFECLMALLYGFFCARIPLIVSLLLIPMCQIGVSFLQLFANLFMTGVPIHSLAFTAAVKCTPTSTTFGDRFSHNPT